MNRPDVTVEFDASEPDNSRRQTRAEWRPPRRGQKYSQVPVLGKYKREKVRIARLAKGEPTSAPTALVQKHVIWLTEIGFSSCAIGAAAGVSDTTVTNIKKGEYASSNIGPARRILSVDHIPCPAQAGTSVPNVGVRRRIHALHAIGWPRYEIGRRLGVSGSQVRVYANSERNLYETWAKIKSLYDELSGTPGYSSRTLKRARRMQYAPPLAWDGIDIDHPAAMPNMAANDSITAGVDEVLLERIIAERHHGEIPRAERLAVLDYAIKNELGKLDVARILRMNDAAACQALVRRRRELRQKSA